MKFGRFPILFFVLTLFIAGTALGYQRDPNSSQPAPKQKPAAKTSLEIQAIQSREFDTTKKMAFASVLSVFQDLGYIVSDADLETGFITAKSPTERKNKFFYTAMNSSKATAFIEAIGDKRTKIRLNFVNNVERQGAYGSRDEKETAIDDPTIYTNAFTKIEEAIFIRSGSN